MRYFIGLIERQYLTDARSTKISDLSQREPRLIKIEQKIQARRFQKLEYDL